MCKSFPLSLLYEKIIVQDRILQNLNYFARNKQQHDSGCTKTLFTNDLGYNMLHVLIVRLCNVRLEEAWFLLRYTLQFTVQIANKLFRFIHMHHMIVITLS